MQAACPPGFDTSIALTGIAFASTPRSSALCEKACSRDRLRSTSVATKAHTPIGCGGESAPAARVFAFEPQPRQVAYLQKAFSSLPFDNVVLVPTALSDTVGRASLHVPDGAGKTHAATLEQGARSKEQGARESDSCSLPGTLWVAPCSSLSVATTTLDAFFADEPRGPDFLKIDVEGHELAVLNGGRKTLEMHHPSLLIECEARHRPDGDVRPVFDLLQSLGYNGTFFHNGRRRPLTEFDPTVHQKIESDSDGLPHGYVNNFAFE